MNRTAQWAQSRQKLWELYRNKGINTCELRLNDRCTFYYSKGFAHRHKRRWYYDKPDLLGDFSHTIMACNSCHNIIEYNKALTEEVFKQLRENRKREYGYQPLDYQKLLPLDKRISTSYKSK